MLNRNDMDTRTIRGALPQSAPLAMAYVPLQTSVQPAYDSSLALARGTLFPGLDLPFMNLVNDDAPPSPQTELMAICFVCDELALYLDTHSGDGEAFELFQTMLALKKEACERYVRQYGPISRSDLAQADAYAWLCDPWPWEYRQRKEV